MAGSVGTDAAIHSGVITDAVPIRVAALPYLLTASKGLGLKEKNWNAPGNLQLSLLEYENKKRRAIPQSFVAKPKGKDKAELPLLPSEVEYGSFFAESLLIEGFKPLKRKLLSLRLKRCIDCGGFRRVTPTFFQFLDNRSRIMLAAGANPIFAHTSLVVWELNQKHRMKGSFQDLCYFPPFFFLVT
ncbi:LOW QUALITY PROTEIN: uncharacterized protein LOC141817397 [Curcuma longa]|uniref:LOW QUALITY PROTEIN: uncharacterized protein LOC141817397 n=1 Tax=Curcuma longa TaxID=136217 RepID=UPI003D9E1C46